MLQGDKSEIHFSLSKFAAETQNCSRGGVSSHRSPMLNLSWIHIRFTPKCNQHVDIRVNKQRFDWIGLCSVLCPRQHSVIWETVFLQHTAPSSVTLVRQLHRSKREFTWSDITSGLTSCMSYNVSKNTPTNISTKRTSKLIFIFLSYTVSKVGAFLIHSVWTYTVSLSLERWWTDAAGDSAIWYDIAAAGALAHHDTSQMSITHGPHTYTTISQATWTL